MVPCQFCEQLIARSAGKMATCIVCKGVRKAVQNIKTPDKSPLIKRYPQLAQKIASMLNIKLDI